ncbi:MAG TPA: chorismate-binding protein, partial [Flavobacterium sp.]|nr:chorismate-binding protein [Flavobacterium sp.]
MTDLFVKVKIHQEQNLPFCIFSKPNSETILGLFQKNDHLYFLNDFSEKGFVFAPFDADDFPFIPLEHSDVFVEKKQVTDFFHDHAVNHSTSDLGNDFFENLVAKGVSAIKEKQFLKVVLSRKEEVELTDFDLEIVFKKMLHHYPSAFNYCFYHPKIGMWIGATPEQFIQTNGTELKTVALAGT